MISLRPRLPSKNLTLIIKKQMSNQSPTVRPIRSGSVLNLVLVGIFGAIALAVGAYLYLTSGGPSQQDQPLTAKAFVGTFVKEVLDQGEIQSSENVEIRCLVQSRYGSKGATIKSVVEEGTSVKSGDVVVVLNSDEIEAALEEQEISVNNAKDVLTAAKNNLAAEEAAKNEYIFGKYKEERELLLNAISQAGEELEKAKDYLKYSRKLQAKSFITQTQLRSDEAALDRAERTLTSANNSLHVLDKYTLAKFQSEFDSKINIATSKMNAATANLEIEEKKLEEIKDQKDKCEIRVPEGESGQVVYANIFSRRGSAEFVLEEGASVREGQVLIKLPNPKMMQVRATVNESRVTSIEENMPVVVAVDALNGAKLDGIVTKVNQYAEPDGWGSGGVRKYAIFINIENPISEIRPGMNASVTIETERIADALMVPIQGIYGYRGKTFCLVKKGDSWETREVTVGSNNDANVVVEEGLQEGEEIALNPAGFRDLMDLPDLPEIEEDKKSKSKKKQGPNRESKGKSERGKKSGKPGEKPGDPDETKSPSKEKSNIQKEPADSKGKSDSTFTKGQGSEPEEKTVPTTTPTKTVASGPNSSQE